MPRNEENKKKSNSINVTVPQRKMTNSFDVYMEKIHKS